MNHLKMRLRAFHTDNERSAGETVWDFCRSMGFVVEFIVVDTPEQNSFAERAGGGGGDYRCGKSIPGRCGLTEESLARSDESGGLYY